MNHEPSKSEIALLISQRIMQKLQNKCFLSDESGVNVSIRGEVRSGMSMASLAISKAFDDLISTESKVEGGKLYARRRKGR